MTDYAILASPDRLGSVNATLASAYRLIIKIGSGLIFDLSTREVRTKWLKELTGEIKTFKERGQEVLIVTSGAIPIGRARLGRLGGRMKLNEKQAAAAVGQMHLAQLFKTVFAKYDMAVAQILLTREDTESRCGYMNVRATLNWLLKQGVVPVINENDVVSSEGICFGDNDGLAAYVARIVTADALVLLSDVGGLEAADPCFAEEVHAARSRPRGSSNGTAAAKLEAVRIATDAGCRVAIAPGNVAINNGIGARWFVPKETPLSRRRRWIARSVLSPGAVTVDDVAAAGLCDGMALLPVAMLAAEGSFDRGDTILIRKRDGFEIGRGLAAYPHHEAARICGCQSDEIAERLGYRGPDAIIDSEDLVPTATISL